MGDDDVLFRIGFQDSPDAYQQLEKLAKSVEATQNRITAGVAEIGRKAAEAAAQAKGASGGAASRTGSESGAAGAAETAVASASQDEFKRINQSLAEIDRQATAISKIDVGAPFSRAALDADKLVKAVERAGKRAAAGAANTETPGLATGGAGAAGVAVPSAAAGSAEEAAKWARAWKSARDQDLNAAREHASALQTLTDTQVVMATEASDELVKALGAVDTAAMEVADTDIAGAFIEATEAADELSDAVEEVGNESAGAAEKAKKAADEAAKAHQDHASKVQGANDRLEETAIGTARAIGGVISGVAMLSASQSEDIQEALRLLAAVQGGINMFAGSMDAIKNATMMMRAYAEARSLAGVTDFAGGAAGGGAARNMAGDAAAGAAGGAATRSGVLGRVGGRIATASPMIGRAGAAVGAGAAGLGAKGMAATGASAVGGGAAVLTGAFAAAAAAIGFAGVAAKQTITGLMENGLGGGVEVDSMSDKVGGAMSRFVDWIGDATGAFNLINDEMAREAEVRREQVAFQQEMLRMEKQAVAAAETERRTAMRGAVDAKDMFMAATMTPEERLAQLGDRDAQESIQRDTLSAEIGPNPDLGNDDGTLEKWQEIESLDQRRLQRAGEMRDLAIQIADEKIRGAEQDIQLAEQSLIIEEKKREAIEESLMTAKERFANMSKEDQLGALAARRKLEEQGSASLTDRDQELLDKVGTKDARAGVRESRIAEADAMGFGDTFGTGEARDMRNSKEETKALNTTIKDERKFIAQINADEEKMMAAMEDLFTKTNAEQIKRIEQRFQVMIEEIGYQQGQQRDARVAANRAAAG